MTKKLIFTICIPFILIFILFPIAFAYTPGSVQVTVKDFYTDAALSGAEVKMEPGGYTDTTNPSGIVTFTNIIPYRNYSITVTLDGYIEDVYGTGRTGLVWVETGQTTYVAIPIKKKGSIQGTVTSPGCGSSDPVNGALVVLFRPPVLAGMSEDDEYIGATHTDEYGNYSFPEVAEGTYRIRAVADFYYKSTYDEIVVGSDETVTKDFSIDTGTTSLSFSVLNDRNYYNRRADIAVNVSGGQNVVDRYVSITEMPPGAQALDIDKFGFLPTLGGYYTIGVMLTDENGIGKEAFLTKEMVNYPADAIPSVIPGPSELPLLYNGVVYADSRGTVGIRPGDKVYFRGWGRDYNLNAPEEYNPDAPMFDIYGNKNGDWSQSAFSFSWSLRDGNGVDKTSLLSSTTTENVYFTVPGDAVNGDAYIATLTVTGDDAYGSGPYAGDPVDIEVVVSDFVGTSTCAMCHSDTYATYQNTVHATVSVDCEDCHGPGYQHIADWSNPDPTKITKSHWPGICGRCHSQFAEWQKARHSDPLAFGHAEVAQPLLVECYKCHYTEGFIGAVESGDFSSFEYPMSTEVPKDTPNVSCDVCHDPHVQSVSNPVGIRTGSEESVCGTCHEKKWQNATYRAMGDVYGNAYHWGDYSEYQGTGNPHHMTKGCVTCHMAKDITDTDTYGVRKVGGHTLRMRDVGTDGDPKTSDDLLNIVVCQGCHSDIGGCGEPLSFDRNGFMTQIRTKLDDLGDLLKVKNHGFLPPFQPGKCAKCHRGSTLPFISDTAEQTLDKAYTNYKLILHDRSFGIHNPGYIQRLLDDSIAQVQAIGE